MENPERISSVKFLRTLAETFGGLDTVRGRGLHKAAGHMIRMDEALKACQAMAGVDADDWTTRVELASKAAFTVMSAQSTIPMPPWENLDPELRERVRRSTRAALGDPSAMVERPCTDEEVRGAS